MKKSPSFTFFSLFPPSFLFLFSLFFLLTLLAFTHDEAIFFSIINRRLSFFNSQIIWFTTFGFILVLLSFFIYSFLYSPRLRRWLIVFTLSLLFSFFISYFIKFLFQEPRPYELFEIIPLTRERTLSFPSMHTALAFTLLPLLIPLLPRFAFFWFFFALAIGFSRIYLGVHMPSEVFVGALLGLSIGHFWRILVTHFNFFHHWHTKFELRRQTTHLFFGLLLVLLLKWQIIPSWFLLPLSLLGILLSFILLKVKLPLLTYLLHKLERKPLLKTFPGRGLIFFIFSSWLTLTLFDFYIALSAILILTFADSVSHLVGRYFGTTPNPLNPSKNLLGLFAGIFAGTFGANFFVPLPVAFFGSLLGSFVEVFSLRLSKYHIDDNLIIAPLSALLMSLLLHPPTL